MVHSYHELDSSKETYFQPPPIHHPPIYPTSISIHNNINSINICRHFATRPKVVVLGSGWGGFNFIKDVDRQKYDVTCVSPANHFLFTPLLPSSAVGTLEFRAIQEPIRTIKDLAGYYQGKARYVDWDRKVVVGDDIF